MKKRTIGMTMILAAAAMWGTIGTFTRKFGQAGVGSLSLIFYRSLVTAVLLLVYIIVKDRALLKIRIRDLWMFVGSGIVSFYLFNVCYMLSINMNSLAVSAILLYTAPIFVMVFSVVLFKEKLTRQKGIALAAAFAGCVLVSIGGGMKISGPGFALGLGAGLGYALYSIFGTVALRRYHTVTITFYTFAFASIASACTTNLQHDLPLFAESGLLGVQVVLYAVFSTSLPYLLYTVGMSYNTATIASIVSTIEPVVAAVLGFAVFHEALTPQAVAGMALVLASILILNTKWVAKQNRL